MIRPTDFPEGDLWPNYLRMIPLGYQMWPHVMSHAIAFMEIEYVTLTSLTSEIRKYLGDQNRAALLL